MAGKKIKKKPQLKKSENNGSKKGKESLYFANYENSA